MRGLLQVMRSPSHLFGGFVGSARVVMHHNDLRRRLSTASAAPTRASRWVAAVDFCGKGEVSGNSTIRKSRASAEYYLEHEGEVFDQDDGVKNSR